MAKNSACNHSSNAFHLLKGVKMHTGVPEKNQIKELPNDNKTFKKNREQRKLLNVQKKIRQL